MGKPTKKKTNDPDDAPPSPSLSEHSRSASRSPEKKSASPVKAKAATTAPKSEKDRHRRTDSTHSSSASANTRKSKTSSSPTKRNSKKYDPNSHPLNLPPEELRRLSAMSVASEGYPQPQPQTADDTTTATSPAPSSPSVNNVPGAFPQQNGKVNGEKKEDAAPRPPPHRTPTSPPPAKNPTSPPAPTPADAEAFKASGNKYFKAKDYANAIREYTKAIEADPKNATYYNNRAAAYISANSFTAALEDAKTADELDPKNPKVLHRLARVYTNLGRPDEALAVYEQITPAASAKDKAPAIQMATHIKQARQQLEDSTSGSMIIHALDQAEKGLGFGVPRPRKWALMRGEAYLKMGNVNALGDAQNVAMTLLRSNSRDPEALVLRGRILSAQGEGEKAIQHFRSALECDPDFKNAIKYLRMTQKLERTKEEGNTLFKTGKYKDAIEKYTAALEIDPTQRVTNSKILQNRALCYLKVKEFKPAVADCTKALELDPSYTKARKTKAKAMGADGDWEEAVRELKNIQETNPSEPGIAGEIRNAELELKKSKRKDYYKILGVDKEAGESEIKKAYRKGALTCHPDKNPGDEEAAERFKDIGEAYETLSDPAKRQRYDSGVDLQDPEDMFGGGMGGFGGQGMQIDPTMLFNMMNGGGMGGGGGGFSFASGPGGFGGMPGGGRRGGGFQGGGFPF